MEDNRGWLCVVGLFTNNSIAGPQQSIQPGLLFLHFCTDKWDRPHNYEKEELSEAAVLSSWQFTNSTTENEKSVRLRYCCVPVFGLFAEVLCSCGQNVPTFQPTFLFVVKNNVKI